MEFPVQNVFCYVCRIRGRFCAAVIAMFYDGADFLFSAYTENALVVNTDIVIMLQRVTNTPVSHIRMLLMDLIHFFGYTLVKNVIFIIRPAFPFVL